MKYFITPQEVFNLKEDKTPLIFLDIRFDLKNKAYGPEAYAKEHISGAYFVDLESDLSDPNGHFGGNHPFLKAEDLKKLLEAYGATNETIIVAYDDGELVGPAGLIYQGLQAGLHNIRVLEGGLSAWKAAGGATDAESVKLVGGGALEIQPNEQLIVDQDYVKAHKDQKGTVLIDSRSPIRYRGEREPVYPIAGHIPGAKNYFCKDVVKNGQLKDLNELKAHFSALADCDEIILSCGSGFSACVNGLALIQLGLPHKLYNGSYSDWIANPENKVNTGEE